MQRKPSMCEGCPLQVIDPGGGFVPAHGSGDNGVLMVLEAAGGDEAAAGIPTVGRAGHYLWSQLARAGIEREGFRIHNVCSCQPPKNFLSGAPYEAEAISHCRPNLDATIADMQERCRINGKHLTILTLGCIAFKRIMDLDDKSPILKQYYLCYPFWSNRYQAYIVAGHHPSYLMRGNSHLLPILHFGVGSALDVATNGLTFDEPVVIEDPAPATFDRWVKDYRVAWEANPTTIIAYDIETPHKQGRDEADVAREDQTDYTIIRISFAYQRHEAVSVPWNAHYLPYIEDLFRMSVVRVGWNSKEYDDPRIAAQLTMNGQNIDGMVAWHVLQTRLPKGLGAVSPF